MSEATNRGVSLSSAWSSQSESSVDDSQGSVFGKLSLLLLKKGHHGEPRQ